MGDVVPIEETYNCFSCDETFSTRDTKPIKLEFGLWFHSDECLERWQRGEMP